MIQITDRAAAHIQKMLARRGRDERALRLGLRAGGCSGFEYTFGWEASPGPGDSVFDGPDGARVFVDAKSLGLLDGHARVCLNGGQADGTQVDELMGAVGRIVGR